MQLPVSLVSDRGCGQSLAIASAIEWRALSLGVSDGDLLAKASCKTRKPGQSRSDNLAFTPKVPVLCCIKVGASFMPPSCKLGPGRDGPLGSRESAESGSTTRGMLVVSPRNRATGPRQTADENV